MKKTKTILALIVCSFVMLSLGSAPVVLAGGGGECAGDVDGDGQTGILDFLAVLAAFGEDCSAKPCDADLDGDGMVGITDLLTVLMDFGCGAATCTSNADCDDGNACTLDLCIQGNCFNLPIPECE